MTAATADTTPPTLHAAERARARVAAGFGALVVLTYGLIVLGALVRANGAGLACPDWPLCFGEVVPTFDIKVAFEWGHRAVAGSISLLFAGLGYQVLRRPALRARAGRFVAIAAALLSVQILLGALTVWKLLASWTVTSHLLTGNAFGATLLVIALSLREAPAVERVAPSLRALLAFTGLALFFQMMLGGLVASNYAGVVCGEWPTCNDGVWFPSFAGALGYQLLHRLGAYTLLAALAASAFLARGTRLGPAVAGALALGLCQLVVGVLNVLWRVPVELTGLHSALAAALVLTLTYLHFEAWRGGRQASQPGAT